jgi:hypothetical protein
MSGPYEIRYAEEAADDIRGLRAFDRRKVLDAIEQQIVHVLRVLRKTTQPTPEESP